MRHVDALDRACRGAAADVATRSAGRLVGTAESLTAGRIARWLASVEGATDYFRGGLVAYQPWAKQHVLGVQAMEVLSPGAAAQMASGVAALLEVDAAVATTGLADDAPHDGVPGGTVYVATWVDGRLSVGEHQFDGDPDDVCAQACLAALRELSAALGARRSG